MLQCFLAGLIAVSLLDLFININGWLYVVVPLVAANLVMVFIRDEFIIYKLDKLNDLNAVLITLFSSKKPEFFRNKLLKQLDSARIKLPAAKSLLPELGMLCFLATTNLLDPFNSNQESLVFPTIEKLESQLSEFNSILETNPAYPEYGELHRLVKEIKTQLKNEYSKNYYSVVNIQSNQELVSNLKNQLQSILASSSNNNIKSSIERSAGTIASILSDDQFKYELKLKHHLKYIKEVNMKQSEMPATMDSAITRSENSSDSMRIPVKYRAMLRDYFRR